MSPDFEAAVRRYIRYDPVNGVLRWREAPNRKVVPGEPAGYITPAGYHYVTVGYVKTTAARIAWFLGHGTWPAGRVFAENGDALDIRLANLRTDRSKTHMQDIFNKPREQRTLTEWQDILDFNPDDAEWISEEGKRARRLLEILS